MNGSPSGVQTGTEILSLEHHPQNGRISRFGVDRGSGSPEHSRSFRNHLLVDIHLCRLNCGSIYFHNTYPYWIKVDLLLVLRTSQSSLHHGWAGGRSTNFACCGPALSPTGLMPDRNMQNSLT